MLILFESFDRFKNTHQNQANQINPPIIHHYGTGERPASLPTVEQGLVCIINTINNKSRRDDGSPCT